jgi:hypothetical protein
MQTPTLLNPPPETIDLYTLTLPESVSSRFFGIPFLAEHNSPAITFTREGIEYELGERISAEDPPELKLIETLAALDFSDREAAHATAENALMTYLRASGHAEVADCYEECRERVGFWYS